MRLINIPFTENIVYKRNINPTDQRYIDFQRNGPKGIIVHDTSAGNPELRRYVAPDFNGLIGRNQFNNHWNQASVGELLVHAWIGKLVDGSVATVQAAPWNFRGLHVGSGTKGSYNNTHVGFEICDDGYKDANYFNAVYKEAVELCATICKEWQLDPIRDGVILGHYEAYQRGMGSNHNDPRIWFTKFGKSMNSFRSDVKKELDKLHTPTPIPIAPVVVNVSLDNIIADINGNIIITFNEPMNTTFGVVQLNNLPVLTGGLWSANNTIFTIPYYNLSHSTEYMVNISAFRNASGIIMSVNNRNNFSTVHWAKPVRDYLINTVGMVINQERYNDFCTRGETMAFLQNYHKALATQLKREGINIPI